MFNSWFQSNGGDFSKENLFSPLSPWDNYSVLLKAIASESWFGRSIYFLSSMTISLPHILPIVQIAHKFFSDQSLYFNQWVPGFFSDKQSQLNPLSLQAKSQSSQKPSEDEVFDAEEDGDLNKENEIKLDHENDEIVAKQLQDEWNAGDSKGDEALAKQLQDKWSVGDSKEDEALAKQLQDKWKTEADEAQKLQDEFSAKSGEEYARMLQQEEFEQSFDASVISAPVVSAPIIPDPAVPVVPHSVIPNPDPVPPLKDEMTLEEVEKMKKEKEATYQILNTQGLAPYIKKNKKDPTAQPRTFYELQTGVFRAVTAALTKEYPQAINPKALREQRDVNFEQYLALRFKQFSHIQQVTGVVTLPSKKQMKLKGSFEVIIAPTIIASYETFSKKSNFFTKKDNEWILSQFNQMLFSDYLSKKEEDNMITTLQDPDFVGPLTFLGGFVDHYAGFTWVGNHLLYADRSCIHTQPGTYVLHIPDRALITEEFIKELVKREDLDEKNYQIVEKFLSQLNATVVHYEPMRGQKVGNCTEATMEAVLNDLMAVRALFNQTNGKMEKVDGNAWKQAFDTVKSEYTKWSDEAKEVIFDEIITEIEEWLTHKTSIGQMTLKATYQELLTAWLYNTPGVTRDPVDIKKVQGLLEAIEKDVMPTTEENAASISEIHA